MIYRLATLLSQLTLSPARRIFALQQMLTRAEALDDTDAYSRISDLLEEEIIELRDPPVLPSTFDCQSSASDHDHHRYSAFISLVYSIADAPCAQATHLLEPVYEQLQRLYEFHNRASQHVAAPR